MSDAADSVPDTGATLLDVAVELNYLLPNQPEQVRARRDELARAGIKLTVGQTLIEQKLLSPVQLRQIMAEVEYRLSLLPQQTSEEDQQRRIGSFELIRTISDKGRCRVLQARDTQMNRLVALKVLPAMYKNDTQWSERFRREVLLAGKLNHPNIITVYGAAELAGCPAMVLEYLNAISLGEKLEREGNLPELLAWQVALEVAKALDYAAEQGVIHRDIKPDNILLTVDGLVKIGDMGLSKAMGDDTGLTAAGTTVGTPFYIAPEQARGAKDIDGRADIYALGCTVFHMLTGCPPFMGDAITDIMVKHTKALRPDAREMLPEISEASARLVQRMMAIDPHSRPDTAGKLCREIEALIPKLPEPQHVERPMAKINASRRAHGGTGFHKPASRAAMAAVRGPVPLGSSAAAEPAPAPKPAVKLPQPGKARSAWNRFIDWLANLFS